MTSGEKDKWVLDDIKAHIDFLENRINAIKEEIDDYVKQTPSLKSLQDLLTSIPAIGALTANTLLAEIGDFTAFENAPQLAAYAGLNPKGHSSGSSIYKKAHISKEGRSELRCCLYMPAVVALKCNPVIQSLAERLRERRLPEKAIVVAAMRKLLHLAFGVIKTQLPFDPNYGAQFDFSS